MDQVTTKQQKSIYHIFIWIAVLSLIMIGLLEWGYIAGGRAFGNYKVYTGLVPWCTWIVMTYLATRPKWFTSRYNLGDMYKVHRALGIIFIVGFLLLMKRRFTVPAMKVNTSGLDKWLYLFLTLAIFSGMAGTLLNASGFFDYRVSIGPWFRSLLSFMPDPSLMEGVPFMFKFHMLAWMVVAIIFPFSRLVHCLSVPLNYLTRPFIVYRKRDEK